MAVKRKMNNVVFSVIWGAVVVVVLAALIVANVLAGMFAPIITTALGQTNVKIVPGEDDGKGDYEYFKSEFASADELHAASERLCEEVMGEGLVLLKNEGETLPLGDAKKVSLFNMGSYDIVYGGTGSGGIDVSTAPKLKAAFESVGYSVNDKLWKFYEDTYKANDKYHRGNMALAGDGATGSEFRVNEVPYDVLTADAKSAYAQYNDAAIVVLSRSGGEGSDLTMHTSEHADGKGYLTLTPAEKSVFAALEAENAFDKVIVVVNSSNAMELGFLDEYSKIKSALWIGGPGQTGLYAVCKAIKGDIVPSGRLVDTYVKDAMSAPAAYNFGDISYTNASELDHLSEPYFGSSRQYTAKNYVAYLEGIYVGYRYYETRYEDVVLGAAGAGGYAYADTVMYPFGYGLSYTTYTYSNVTVKEKDDDTFTVSVKVKNDTATAGKEVVQVYLNSPYTAYDKSNGIEKSAVQLVGFDKVSFAANEEKTVSVDVAKEELRAYDAKSAKTYILDAGDYYFSVGKNAHDALNNVLAAKKRDGETVDEAKMTAAGDASLTAKWKKSGTDPDKTVFATGENDKAIANRFADADIKYYYPDQADAKYVSRSDWTGTLPTAKLTLTATEKVKTDLAAKTDIDTPAKTAKMPTFGAQNGLTVVMLKGKDYDHPDWEKLLDQMTKEEMIALTTIGGYKTYPISSVAYPGTTDKDGPAGISGTLVGGKGSKCMAYPAEIVRAATWNRELTERLGQLVGEDGLYAGIHGWYAPAMNIHRTAFTGRTFEYYSEDPYLSGMIGASEVKGAKSKGMMTYIKHFAVNDQDTNRKGLATYANEQSIREIYLRPFELAVRVGGSNAVMTSHNRIGTRWAASHASLLNDVLRGEWGFVGHIVTDYVGTPVYQSALEAIVNGNDLMLSTNVSNEDLSPEKNNPFVMTQVRKACHNILYTGVNSAAMNGVKDTDRVEVVLATWQKWLIVLDVFLGAALIAAVVWVVIRVLRNRKLQKGEA